MNETEKSERVSGTYSFVDFLSRIEPELHQLMTCFAKRDGQQIDFSRVGLAFVNGLLGLMSGLGGGPIVPVPRLLIRTAELSNRIVSFVLDREVHFGTGVLIGPDLVLTASHLFFEQETGRLIDRARLKRITVEARTTLIDNILMPGPPRTANLYQPEGDLWLLDPPLRDDVAQRDLLSLDFAIVRIDERFGDDHVGGANQTRKWFELPTADDAPVLSDDLIVHVFEFLDREELLTSVGQTRGIVDNGYRVLHTASTLGSGSGAPLVDSELNLLAIHIGGAVSGEVPRTNRALPIRRVAEIIDQPLPAGSSIRSMCGRS
jgi:hypothetical protein